MTECTSQLDPGCSAVNGGATGNTNSGSSNSNRHHGGGSHGGADPGGDILGGSGNTWHGPDYWTIQVGLPLPIITEVTLGIINGTGSFTYSNGHWYLAGGLNAGKTLVDILAFGIPISGNLSGGWLLQPNKASPEQMHKFLTGWAINGSVGVGIGGGVTWGNVGKYSKNAFAGEGGLYTPQIGATATYTLLDLDTRDDTWTWLP